MGKCAGSESEKPSGRYWSIFFIVDHLITRDKRQWGFALKLTYYTSNLILNSKSMMAESTYLVKMNLSGLADAACTNVSRKLTWLPLGPLHNCSQKIRKENFKPYGKDDIWQSWQWPGHKVDLLDDSKLNLKALDYNRGIDKDTFNTFDIDMNISTKYQTE